MKYTAPRGTFDILPDQAATWQFIETEARKVFDLYNYKEIRTPIFESTDLFARSIGSTTDIVSKEMYTFQDKKGRSLSLRPEETAPVVRACLENNLIGLDKITKLFYIGPMFRYERPQAGRFRQFHQIGVEAFGSADPLIDAEIIILAVRLFEKLGLEGLEVDINSVGCLPAGEAGKDCRPAFLKELKVYFKSNIKNMCDECKKRLEFNPLRILDCKNKVCQKYIQKAPAPLDFICGKCKENFEATVDLLKGAKVNCQINNRLVRGLDYYTGITFEVISKKLGAQNAVCGGGRYNDLVYDLGGKSIPASGFAVGVERVIEVLKGFNVKVPSAPLKVFVATMGDEAKRRGFEIAESLRRAGVSSEMDYIDRSLKAKMKAADKSGAKFTVIIGEDELKKNVVVLRKMEDGSQKEIKAEEVPGELA
jgi:histidyl-tRNA synthetase